MSKAFPPVTIPVRFYKPVLNITRFRPGESARISVSFLGKWIEVITSPVHATALVPGIGLIIITQNTCYIPERREKELP